MQFIQSFEHQLAVLANAFTYRQFVQKHNLEASEFQNKRLQRLFEKLMELKAQNYTADDCVDWMKEAGRRASENIEDLLEADQFAGDYHLSEMRLASKQDAFKNYALEVDRMSPEELEEAVRTLGQKSLTSTGRRVVSVADYAPKEYLEFLKDRLDKKNALFVGRKQFDSLVGAERGQLITLAARPSVGKSALALNLAYEWAQFGFKVFYATLEMSPEELTHRLFARITGKSSTLFKYGKVDDVTLQRAVKELKNMPGKIVFAQMGGARIDEVLAEARREDFDIVILDHIDLIQSQNAKDSEAYAIARVTSALKGYAQDRNALVFCLSQFNRESKGEMPEMHQLRGSGAKEQDSDVILILHRPLSPDEKDFGTATLRVAKNRSGQVGDILLTFTPETTTFHE